MIFKKGSRNKIFTTRKKHIEKLFAQIEELKDKSDFNQRLRNQDIKKEIKDYKSDIIRLNKIVNDKDRELTHIRQKLGDQESVVDQYQQQIKVLQQQNDDYKKAHKLKIAKSNKALSNNSIKKIRIKKSIIRHWPRKLRS